MRTWLSRSLNELGVDGAEFAVFISSLLEEDQGFEAVRELLSGLELPRAKEEELFASIVSRWTADPENFNAPEPEPELVPVPLPVPVPEPGLAEAGEGPYEDAEFDAVTAVGVFESDTWENDNNDDDESDAEAAAHAAMEQQLAVLSLLESLPGVGDRFALEAIFGAVAASEDSAVGAGPEAWAGQARALLVAAEQRCATSRPCRHLMHGSCLRADCNFDHELSSLPCRFWLLLQAGAGSGPEAGAGMPMGGCLLAGQGCKFAHAWEVFLPLLESLPALAPAPAPAPAGSFALHGADGSAAAAAAAAAFPALAPSGDAHASRPGAAGGWAAAAWGRSGATVAGGYRAALASGSGPAHSARLNSHTSKNSNRTSNSGGGGGGGGGRGASVSVGAGDWVDSGASVGTMYTSLREEARALAIARNKMLEEATRAFSAGQGAQARALSARGRELNEEMHAKHRQCAEAIFRARNPRQRLQAGQVDLHGLHCAEAEALLYGGLLESLRQSFGLRSADVVTGSGNHTLGPQKQRARLLPAVEAAVRELGLRYSHIKDPQGFAGGLRVSLA